MFFESFPGRRDLFGYAFESKEENRRDSVNRNGTSRDVHSLLRDVLSGIKGQLVRLVRSGNLTGDYKFFSNSFLSI